MTQNELNNKIAINNSSTDFHTINLLKYIPKFEKNQKFTNNKFNSIKEDKKLRITPKKSNNKSRKNENKTKHNIFDT